jgi:beta-lactamase class A
VDQALERVVRQSIRGDEGQEDGEEHFAVVVKNLADGRGMALAPERTFYAASLFKIWVMLEAFHQRETGLLDFHERYFVSDYYEAFGLNRGELASCAQVAVSEALGRMLAVSDNVAANLLLDRVGSANVNATLRQLGLESSSVPADGSLPTTAADIALLLEVIARGDAISEAARHEMLELLASESIADRLPYLLPAGTQVAHKTGNWQNATHDAGIVFSPQATYVIVVLTDLGYQDDGATRIATLSRAVYDYYNEN